VRATAEIQPIALLVDFQRLVLGDRIDQFNLVVLTLAGKERLGLVARPQLLGKGLVSLDDLLHLLFNDRQVFRREGLFAVKIIVEAVFDDRPDGDRGTRPQFLNGFGHHMGRVMADQFQRPFISPRYEFYRAIATERIGKITQFTIIGVCDGVFGQRFGNAFSDFAAGRRCGEFTDIAIGKSNRNLRGVRHLMCLLSSPAYGRGWLIGRVFIAGF